MTITKLKQQEVDARKLERQCKFIGNAQRVYANKEGNRLNRLYKEEFREYKKMRALPALIKKRDEKNAILDRLYKLVWYTYYRGKDNNIEVRAMKTRIKRLIGETPRAERTAQDRPVLTRDRLMEVLCYDPEEGTFERDSGMEEGKLATHIANAKRKVPRKDRYDGCKLRAKNYVPYHKGFFLVTQEAYLAAYETELAAINKKACLHNLPPYKVNEKDFTVFKRCYYIRVPKGEVSTLAAKRVDYYLKQHPSTLIVKLPCNTTSYAATHLAYLYMGAGGNWDYSEGLDNAVRVNTDCAPHGLKYYSKKTNKPVRIPCRDGDRLNLKWANIKPYEIGEPQYISPACIVKVPNPDKPPRKPTPQPASRKTISYRGNIKEMFIQTAPTTPCYGLHNMGSPPFYSYDYAEAKEELVRRLNALPGHKQLLRNGSVMVITPAILG